MINNVMYTLAAICVETKNNSTTLRWITSICFLVATIIMISPAIASKSPIPWGLYLIGNAIWMVDSLVHKINPWFWTAIVFLLYDLLLVYSRIYNVDTIVWIKPFVQEIEYFLL